MATYDIHKGVGKSVEFKGLTAQYLYILCGGLLGDFLLFVILYMLGINEGFCIVFCLFSALSLVFFTFRLNAKYGQYGLMKLSARRNRPRYLSNRKTIYKLFENKSHEKYSESVNNRK